MDNPLYTLRRGFVAFILSTMNLVLGFFDRGLDGILANLTSVEAKLARYQDRLDARIAREQEVQTVSYAREYAACCREWDLRKASRGRVQDMRNDYARALRVRERIERLIG